MRLGVADACLAHDPGRRHPESPARLRAILDVAEVDRPTDPEIDRATLTAVHDPAYLDSVAATADDRRRLDPDTVVADGSWRAARASAGLAVWGVEAALDGTPAFALGRPPGHHARADRAAGFCLLNNAAVAVERALSRDRGASAAVGRVAVVDWDVHHGDGTQALFYDRPEVLYASVHGRGIYPGTGAPRETGERPGEGTTLNLPVPPTAGDRSFRACLDRVVAPAVADHDPDLVVVSAGFDAHEADHLSRASVTTEGFADMAARIRTVADDADAALAFVLEGGYAPRALAESVRAVREAVADGRDPEPTPSPPADVPELIADGRRRLGLSDP